MPAATIFPEDALEVAQAYTALPDANSKNMIRRSLALPELAQETAAELTATKGETAVS